MFSKGSKDYFFKVINRLPHNAAFSWLVVLGFYATLTAKVISWRTGTHMFSGFLTPVQLFFPKPLTTFLTCFCRGERQKYAGKKSRLSRGSNSQLPGHESDTLTTELPGWGMLHLNAIKIYSCRKHCEKRRNSLFLHFKCTFKCLQFVSIWTSLKFCRLGTG